MKVLTFVIPAYNAAAFLRKCVESMLVPALMDRLEILIVNDGSTDETGRIAEEYCSQYPETVRVICQENRGHGGALNAGCAAATGKYLKVIDADDWVSTESLLTFVARLEQCQSDVVLTHVTTVNVANGNEALWKMNIDTSGKEYRLQEIMERWFDFAPCMNLHGITYRRAFYHACSDQLPEHVFYEDHVFSAFPCCYAESVMALDLPLYVYRTGDENQSISRHNQLKRMDQLELVLRHMIQWAQRIPENACAARLYVTEKIRVVLMRCLTTALLAHPDRKTGRKIAREQMAMCKTSAPEVWKQTGRNYRILQVLNRLGVGQRRWEIFLHSSFGKRLRGKSGQA